MGETGRFKVDLKPPKFVAAVMKGIADDLIEIGYGMTVGFIRASRADLDRAFQRMMNNLR